MPKYEKTTLGEAALKASDNAGQLIKDADCLSRTGSYARGLSLLIISREEAQKAILLTYCAVGIYNINESHVGQEIKRSLIDHDYKHEAAWYASVFATYFLVSLAKLLATTSDSLEELTEATEKAVTRLKRQASPKEKRLEFKKWRGLYVGIDSSGIVTHPADLTKEDYDDFYGIALEHYLYALLLQKAIFNAKHDVIEKYKLQADQFRLLLDSRPLTNEFVQKLLKSGQLNEFMAGFGYFIIKHNLIL